MFQTQTHSAVPPCVCQPAPAPVCPPPKFSAELMRMLAQLVMLR